MAWLLQIAISNVVVAAALAVVAVVVDRTWKNAHATHLLWVIVLAKLVTPPLWNVPILAIDFPDSLPPVTATSDRPSDGQTVDHSEWWGRSTTYGAAEPFESPGIGATAYAGETGASASLPTTGESPVGERTAAAEASTPSAIRLSPWASLVLVMWLASSLFCAGTVLIRAMRFHRIASRGAAVSKSLMGRVKCLAKRLDLRRVPDVRLLETGISPIIWPLARRRMLLLPQRLVGELTPAQLDTVIAHELAHLVRRDELVRFLETAVTCLFWWNPVVWLARRRLHAAEENCCDALVVCSLPESRREYGEALLRAAELITFGRSLPVLASAFGQQRDLKRRIERILKQRFRRKTSWQTKLAILAFSVLVLPLAATAVSQEESAAADAKTAGPSAATASGNRPLQVVVYSDAGVPRPNALLGNFHMEHFVGREYSTEDGRVELRVVEGDPRWWFAYSQGYQSMGLFQLPAEVDGDALHVRLTQIVANLEGRVVDRAGRPVAAREVKLRLRTADGQTIPCKPLTTDHSGRYWSYLIPTGGGLSLVVGLSGGSKSVEIDLPRNYGTIVVPPLVDADADVRDQTNEASRAEDKTYGGRVVDEQRRPVAAAEVCVTVTIPAGYSKTFLVPTDDVGKWSLALREDARGIRVRVSHADFVNTSFSGADFEDPSLEDLQSGTATVVLKKGLPVRGTVFDVNGKPLPDARILTHALVASTPGPINEPIADESMIRADERGRFKTCPLPPGKHHLAFYGHRHAPQTVLVDVGPDAPDIEVHMQRGDTLLGQIVDPQGSPLEGVRIGIHKWQSPAAYNAVRWDRTDEAGRFRIDHVPTQGSYSLRYYDTVEGEFVSGSVDKADIQPGSPLLLTLGTVEPVEVFATVVDADTGLPVKEIEIIEGEPLALGQVDFTHGKRVHAASVNGTFWHEVNGAAALRIHAKGYYPIDTDVFRSGDGIQEVRLLMSRGRPFRGTVVDVQGQPVAEAHVAWVGPQRYVLVENGKFFLRGDDGRVNFGPEYVVQTDAQGRFELPPSRAEGLIVIVHPRGYLEIPSTQFPVGKQFKLRPWCRIEGVLTRNGRPAAGEVVVVRPQAAPVGEPRVTWSLSHETDSQGRFAIANVPSLPLGVGYLVGRQLSHVRAVMPVPGEINLVSLGGNAATIVGRIAETEGLEIAEFSDEQTTFQHKTAVFAYPRSQDDAPQDRLTVYFAQLQSNGEFQIEDVPPGEYVVQVAIHAPVPPNSCGVPIAIAGTWSPVDVSDTAAAGTTVELPPLVPELRGGLKVGQRLPEISAKTISGEAIDLTEYRGKLLVLSFWASWCAPSVAEMPHMKQLYESYGRSSEVAFVGVNVDPTPESAHALASKHEISWPQLAGPGWGEENPLLGEFGVASIPSIWLIDANGNVLARDLRARQLEEALRSAGARAKASGD